jgi:hypothetical protein
MPAAGESGEAAAEVMRHIRQINATGKITQGDPAVAAALMPIITLRKIVYDCLADKKDWSEYYVALALCALRAIVWETMSMPSRRLMFLVSALAFSELEHKLGTETREPKTPTPDATDTIPSVSRYEVRRSHSGSSIIVESVSESQSNWQSSQMETSTSVQSTPLPLMGTARLVDPFGDETEHLGDSAVSIQFSAHYPSEVIPEQWYPLPVYLFRPTAAEDVSEDIEKLLDVHWTARPMKMLEKALLEGETITVTPYLEGFQFNPRFIPMDFFDDWQRLDFKVRAKKASTRKFANGFITFSVGGVIVGNIPISITPTETLDKAKILHESCDLYQAIYPSYSPQDRHIDERLERFTETIESGYLSEVLRLRREANAEASLFDLMGKADIFELFWSSAAASLSLVQKEWRHALSINRPASQFLRPVYWSQPTTPLPTELEHLPYLHQPDLAT